ncbi:MAG: glycosyltransferase family 39 protein [Candidatus Omnitrophica bacterium]|nr:glycosyltransferase family 39 protein [Candidatus Omnitrophota bacterium]
MLRKFPVAFFLLALGLSLNVVYTFWIVPLGRNDTFILETKYSGEKPQVFINADSREYITMAINLKNGKGLAYPLENPLPTAYRMPGFPILLSWIFMLFGTKISVALFFQCILLTGIFGMGYLLARMFFTKSVALASLGVMTVWPNLKFYGCAYLGSETLSTFLFYAFLLCVFKWEKHKFFLGWLCAGILFLGGAIYSRPDFILFIPFFIIWLARHHRAKWRAAFFAGITIMFMLAPWAIRNFYVFNKFIPTTTGLGVVLEGCYNPDTLRDNPGGWRGEDSAKKPNSECGKNNNDEISLNKFHMQRGMEYLERLDVSDWPRLLFWKLARLWFPAQRFVRTESGVISLKHTITNFKVFLSKPYYAINGLLIVLCLPIYILFWVRFFLCLSNFRSNELLIYFFVFVNLIAILFWGSLRFRFVFEPFIVIFGCSMLPGHKIGHEKSV